MAAWTGPLAALGAKRLSPIGVRASGERTVTSWIVPTWLPATVTTPFGSIVTWSGVVPSGSVTAGSTRSPLEVMS